MNAPLIGLICLALASPAVAAKRDPAVARQFQKLNPCPSTGKTYGACPGYVKDHVIPLKRGGPDTPANLQWQTREEAKLKDKWE